MPLNRPEKLPAKEIPLGAGVRILNRNQSGMAALEKPAGLLTHPNRPGDETRSLLRAPYDSHSSSYFWIDSIGLERRFYPAHRLDSPTSGVVLGAFDGQAAAWLREAFAERKVRKIYQAWVHGHPEPPTGTWTDPLAKKVRDRTIRVHAGSGQPAETRYRVLQNSGPFTLLQLEPVTGKTHQLRVQCSVRGFPIIGDKTYGRFREDRELFRAGLSRRLYLHALSAGVEIDTPAGPVKFKATSTRPADFESVHPSEPSP